VNRFLVVSFLAVGLAACGPRAGQDPNTRMVVELSTAFKPYADCVDQELRARTDFDGQLAEMVVARGLDARLDALATMHLKSAPAAEGMEEVERVDMARQQLADLGRHGSSFGAMPPGPEQVRRTVAVVDTMMLIAAATDVTCSIPDDLTRSMEKSKNEHF